MEMCVQGNSAAEQKKPAVYGVVLCPPRVHWAVWHRRDICPPQPHRVRLFMNPMLYFWPQKCYCSELSKAKGSEKTMMQKWFQASLLWG